MAARLHKGWWQGVARGLLALCLCLALVSWAVPARAEAKYRDGQRAFITMGADKLENLAKAGIATMKANGVYDAARKYGGSNFYRLLAIAVHESRGRLTAVNPKNVAFCAFQIYYTNLKSFNAYTRYKSQGAAADVKSEHDFYVKLLTDPDTCAKTGAYILEESLKGGEVKGICRYAGQITQYKETGTCFLVDELYYIENAVRAVEGAGSVPPAKIVTDQKSDKYGTNETTDSQGGKVNILNCGKDQDQKDLVVGLMKGAKAYQGAVLVSDNSTFKSILKAQAANPLKEVKGDVGKKYCIDDIKLFYDSLRKLITKLEQFIIDMIVTLVEKLLNKICDVIKSTITSVLEMVCIPFPELSFGLDINGLSAKSCDGISLNDFVNITSGSTSLGISTGSDSGLAPVNASPSFRWSASDSFYELKRRITSKTTTSP